MQDSLIVITPQQLKHTNLIFLEHNKFKKQIVTLNGVINTQKELNVNLEKSLITKDQIISNYEKVNRINEKSLKIKDNEINKQRLRTKGWMIGGISVTVISLILLITK